MFVKNMFNFTKMSTKVHYIHNLLILSFNAGENVAMTVNHFLLCAYKIDRFFDDFSAQNNLKQIYDEHAIKAYIRSQDAKGDASKWSKIRPRLSITHFKTNGHWGWMITTTLPSNRYVDKIYYDESGRHYFVVKIGEVLHSSLKEFWVELEKLLDEFIKAP